MLARRPALDGGFAMDKISVDLQFCYGIKALKYDFDFPHGGRAYAIYAPNGAMKSSFALTFKALSEGAQPRDRIFPDNPTVATVTDQADVAIGNERILVALSYDKEMGPSEQTCTLLVDDKLRAEFAELQRRVNVAEESLTDLLKRQSKSKTALIAEIPSAFAATDLRAAMRRIEPEIKEQEDSPFAAVEYDRVFNEEFVAALNKNDLKSKIASYVERYNELLDQSVFFSRGVFDYYNASEISKNLTKNGFFKAKHTINLKPSMGDIREINTQEELETVIQKEKQSILDDNKLVAEFTEIANTLNANARLRSFGDYLMNNRYILPHLVDVGQFRQDVIKSYIKTHHESYDALIETYASVRVKQEEIEQAAREQETLWQKAIDTFNTRFRVPFTLTVKNQASVVMGRDKVMQLAFTYHDGARKAEFARDDLLEILSQGERRAFYLLNVIFEIRRRQKDGQETLVIVDDIADSFDYQNKYAIVQYLADISEEGLFKLIILTHNFDFFRTIESRFVNRGHCLMASKTDAGITLEPAVGIKDIFSNDWKKGFYTDPRKRISCIPFLRNLVELREGSADPDYLKLTSMLHWKPDSAALTNADLDAIYVKVCGSTGGPSVDPARTISDLIWATADSLPPPGGLNLENKIVLAVAIRMRAEQFMVTKIADPAHWTGIGKHQAPKLIRKFKEMFPNESKSADILDKVALMTPENIHLNAFMYEPIIDMSEDHLRELYTEVKALT